MGLFDLPLGRIDEYIEKQSGLKELAITGLAAWPRGRSLVLEEDAALELGHPRAGSLSMLLWTEKEFEGGDKVMLAGPDLPEIGSKRAPFGQVVMVSGSFDDEYECYGRLRDAMYETRLAGVMARTLPSSRMMWLRMNREAMERGLLLSHLGAALIRSLRGLDFVNGARVLFVTAKEELDSLFEAAEDAGRIVGAMMKMKNEMSFDCDACEFGDVCEKVAELKRIRRNLRSGG